MDRRVDVLMVAKGVLVLACGILASRLAESVVVSTGASIMAATAGENLLAMDSLALEPYARDIVERFSSWLNMIRYALAFIPFAWWARTLHGRAIQRDARPKMETIGLGRPWVRPRDAEREHAGERFDPDVRLGLERIRPRDVALLIVVALGLHGVSNIVGEITAWAMPWTLDSYVEMLDRSDVPKLGLGAMASLVIAAPIFEETVFRGLGFGYLRSSGLRPWIANGIQAACFGAFHGNVFQMVYAFVIGLFLGDVYRRYDVLAATMFLHAAVNVASTVGTTAINAFVPPEAIWVVMVVEIALLAIAYPRLPKPKSAGRR